jgi:hypothetical protein
VRRIDPAFPDLLPVSHRLGGVAARDRAVLDPAEMRLSWGAPPERQDAADRAVPRRALRVLVHAAVARSDREQLARLTAAGCGLVVVLDGELEPGELPARVVAGQAVALAPWLPSLWGARELPDLSPWRAAGIAPGVLLALAPTAAPARELAEAVAAARAAGAEFALAAPLAVPADVRHRVYDTLAGEAGDTALEDLLFHTDSGSAAARLEREASRACRAGGLPESLPGPGSTTTSAPTFAAACALLLWARRLDLLDGVASTGWQLRRAAHALLASGREPRLLLAEDNLRVIPGFSPWVEAFARALWMGGGLPYDEVAARWAAS